ncbi:MAG: hypothetical protein J3K34DRAFT_521291 [Monoraphidium minutum]|nr:MAG: hypothetical protein J3K34DRAFT_521291 [Monoraphidium minutum]
MADHANGDPGAGLGPGGVDVMSQAAQLQAAEAIRLQVEEYVRGRIRQFARDFAKQVAPGMAPDAVDEAANRVLLGAAEPAALPALAPAAPVLQAGQGQYRLEFRHECSALGCRDSECPLCTYNPHRVCERNFQKKYLVGDPLRAKCGASLRVELLDAAGNPVTEGYPDLTFELTLLDGVAFKDRGGESRLLSDEELKACFKLTNHKDEPLLAHKSAGGGGGGGGAARYSIQVRLENGSAALPDLTVTDSSEALLQGRRPPFRLLIWCPDGLGGFDHSVTYTVSDDFVVATRRVKQANKADIPMVNDHVSKIEHIGRETVKKLSDMRAAALETGVDISIDDRMARIETVGQFQNLVRLAEADVQLRKVMQAVLKLSKEKWDEAARHALEAVHPDFRRRVWYPHGQNMGVGLVFSCKDGAVQLRDRIALAQTGPDGSIKARPAAPLKLHCAAHCPRACASVLMEDTLDPASLEILRDLKVTAVKKWAEHRHPGWGIFREPSDSDAAKAAIAAAAAPPPPGLITLGPGAAGALGGGGRGVKRTASAAGLGGRGRGGAATPGGDGGDSDGGASSGGAVGGLGGAGLGAPPDLNLAAGLLPGLAGADPAALAAALAGGAGGWPGAAGGGAPEALAALQAQLGMAGVLAAAGGGGAGGLPPLDAAALAAMDPAAVTAALAAAGGGGGLDGGAGGLGPLGAVSPGMLQALQAQLAAGGGGDLAAGGGGDGGGGGALPFGAGWGAVDPAQLAALGALAPPLGGAGGGAHAQLLAAAAAASAPDADADAAPQQQGQEAPLDGQQQQQQQQAEGQGQQQGPPEDGSGGGGGAEGGAAGGGGGGDAAAA